MSLDLFLECIGLWWKLFSYSTWHYFAFFLPVILLVYHFASEKRRYMVLLAASWLLFFTISGPLLLCNIGASAFCFIAGQRMGRISENKEIKRKERTRLKKRVLILGILLLIAVLALFKYTDFFGGSIAWLLSRLGSAVVWKPLNLAVPVGISYYTLEAISYLTDVYRGTIEPEKNFWKLSLFLSFFPKLFEGPISRYSDTIGALTSGKPLSFINLSHGYQRILYGLFKKVLIADHLAPAVEILYKGDIRDGSVSLMAALCITVQEYMDFSGTIDIVIGSACCFGVNLRENFRQPFFAKNASDFWRRWHITLGTWFKDYIFYPVSLSKAGANLAKKVKERFGAAAAKFAAPTLALFCVWLSNGLWHGPKWNYVIYGLYFFFWIVLENILEEPFLRLLDRLKLSESSIGVRIFRFIKLCLIIMYGEMIFGAQDLLQAAKMTKDLFMNFHISVMMEHMNSIGMDIYDYATVIVGVIIVAIVSTLKEIGFPIRKRLESCPRAVRFAVYYACIIAIVIFGAYGSGYDNVGMFYAKF